MILSFQGKAPQIAPSALVSRGATIIGDVVIGEDSSVWPGAVIRGDVGSIRVGSRVHIEDNCVLHTRDSLTIGDDVVIGHGAVIHCQKVGSHVVIGSTSTLLDWAEVGDWCLIAAGSVVSPGMKIPDMSYVAGVPAKIVGAPPQEHMDYLKGGGLRYLELMRQYDPREF